MYYPPREARSLPDGWALGPGLSSPTEMGQGGRECSGRLPEMGAGWGPWGVSSHTCLPG